MQIRCVGLACLALGVAAAPAAAQKSASGGRDTSGVYDPGAAPAYRYRLLGVYDVNTGLPLDSVQVSDVMTGLSMMTTSTGTVSLIFLPEGGSLVRLRKLGYAMQTFMVPIAPADTTPVTVVMEPMTMLPTVTTTDTSAVYLSPMLQAAENRMRHSAGGYFIDEKTMRKWDNSTMTDAIIAHMPGLMLQPGPHDAQYLVSTRQECTLTIRGCGSPSCYVGVYVDGVPWASGGPIDFSNWTTYDFAMAEFYPGGASVPEQYNSTATGGCGVLLLWTRER